jgi:hypothetical protein
MITWLQNVLFLLIREILNLTSVAKLQASRNGVLDGVDMAVMEVMAGVATQVDTVVVDRVPKRFKFPSLASGISPPSRNITVDRSR